MTTKLATKHGIYEVAEFKALDGATGEFEAIVSVFGNVDAIGDRVVEGAFEGSLSEWRKSGDPIPIIWSHNWGDPFAHIGAADPDRVEELKGRGLLVPGRIDLDNPVAAQVYRLMKARRVTQFSFGYEVRREMRAKDGANELLELGLIEVGPTLRGMNPSTELLDVKSQLEDAAPAAVKTPPWHVDADHADCDGYAVVADETGEVVGCHTTEAAAERHMAALYANVEDADKAGRVDVKVGRRISRATETEVRAIIEEHERLGARMRALLDTDTESDDDDDDDTKSTEPAGNPDGDATGNATQLSAEHLNLVARIAESQARFR